LTFADEDIVVTTVGDGQQAIDRIRSDRPDIVLADAGMPERDGFAVSAFVKGDPDLRHIPVLLLTGAFEPIDEARVRAAGCDGVLAKPFEPQLLIARVRELLAAAEQGRRSGEPRPVPVPAVPQPEPLRPGGMPQAAPDLSSRTLPAAEPAGAGVPPVTPPASTPSHDELALPPFTPAQEAGSPLSLDEYFDQLDAAFATMTPSAEPTTAPPLHPAGEPWAGGPADTEWIQQIVRDRVDAGVPAAPPVPQVPPASPPSPGPNVPLASAFSAMLAVERGEVVPPELLAATGVPPVPVDALVEDITRRVVERLADRAVRDQVADIVSAVAERLVREEIQRLKGKL
jgi:CheY-like chemotaxis protein